MENDEKIAQLDARIRALLAEVAELRAAKKPLVTTQRHRQKVERDARDAADLIKSTAVYVRSYELSEAGMTTKQISKELGCHILIRHIDSGADAIAYDDAFAGHPLRDKIRRDRER